VLLAWLQVCTHGVCVARQEAMSQQYALCSAVRVTSAGFLRFVAGLLHAAGCCDKCCCGAAEVTIVWCHHARVSWEKLL
jgi:hypothetical protein